MARLTTKKPLTQEQWFEIWHTRLEIYWAYFRDGKDQDPVEARNSAFAKLKEELAEDQYDLFIDWLEHEHIDK